MRGLKTGSGSSTNPNHIYLSSAEWELITDEKTETLYMTNWELAMYHWDTWSIGHRLKALWYAIKAIVMKLWNGASEFGGWIQDGLSKVWESFKRFGEWIYTNIMEFVGKIWNFISNAIDTIVGFWDFFKYLVAPLVMMAVIGPGGTLCRKLLNERGT